MDRDRLVGLGPALFVLTVAIALSFAIVKATSDDPGTATEGEVLHP